MANGRERLWAWMAKYELNQREAARQLGMHWTSLHHILTGRRRVGLAVACKIEDETGIPVRAWKATRVGKRAKRRDADTVTA